jgi:hydroxyethylthiazole kinase
MIDVKKLIEDLNFIREKSPLVHNITNFVVMNNTANGLLAIGASPVMAHAVEEMEDMVSIASALVINMGTLSKHWVDGMLLAGKTAKIKRIPVIFDPVGAGATPYRSKTAEIILKECKPEVIRGNASEIMSLAKSDIVTKGVDSSAKAETALALGKKLALQTGAIVSISGQEDFITDGQNINTVKNGSLMMPKVTGLGCTASAITGAFAAVNKDLLAAASHAMAVMGITGELAAQKSEGPGSLQVHFLDILYNLTGETIMKTIKL